MSPALTYEQQQRKSQRQRLHYERQNLMPEESRPRRSPHSDAPPRRKLGTKMVSLRCCMEQPATHPNDFRYLYMDGNGDYPRYVWLNSEAKMTAGPFKTLSDAFRDMINDGWMDASW
jgi:hypothetical protein